MKNPDGDLFDGISIDAWLLDETLFSLCSRHHKLSGNYLSSSTCQQLFGHSTQGCAHDFPSRVAAFVSRTKTQLGSAEEIIRNRTILPFYLPFQTIETISFAYAAMSGGGISSLKYRLGLLTSRFRAHHPLKSCPICIEQDRLNWGVAYWHRSHQLPGVWVCMEHRVPLLMSSLKSTGVQRFNWLLPSTSHMSSQIQDGMLPMAYFDLAAASTSLAILSPKLNFDANQVAITYRNALRERGLLKGDKANSLNLKEIGKQYSSFSAQFREVDELKALPATEEDAAREVARLAHAPRSHTHPLRHLVLILWLFGSLDSFIRAYKSEEENLLQGDLNKEADAISQSSYTQELRQQFLNLIKDGNSPSGAARRLGVDPATGIAWAASAGIATDKRPSIIKGDLRKKMIRALKRGAPKEAVAKIGGVSVQSVTRLLRTEIGLQDKWHEAKFQNARRSARRKWLRIIAANPNCGVKAVRMLERAAYVWLYRWDREWLDAQNKFLSSINKTASPRVDWDSRDQSLAHEVETVAIELANAAPGSKIKLWQLYQRIPELRAKLSCLDRLPLTRNVIQNVLKASTNKPTLIQA